jgi:hypothetical protein
VLNNIALTHPGPPPAADNGLINGTMVGTSGTGGRYNKVTMVKGKKYRLRLINTSMDNSFRVTLDGHNLTVIQADFVPTKPYTAQTLFIGIGERYDVIINANQNIDNYWFRARVMTSCGVNNNNGNIMSIFSYAGAPSTNPTSTSWNIPNNCADETGLTPYVVKNVPSATFANEWRELGVMASVGVSVNGIQGSVVQWTLNTSAIDVSWSDPTLEYVVNNNENYDRDDNVIRLPTADKVSEPATISVLRY